MKCVTSSGIFLLRSSGTSVARVQKDDGEAAGLARKLKIRKHKMSPRSSWHWHKPVAQEVHALNKGKAMGFAYPIHFHVNTRCRYASGGNALRSLARIPIR